MTGPTLPDTRGVLADVLASEPDLFLNPESSLYLIWVDRDSMGTVGYWVTVDMQKSDGSAFVLVSWTDGSDDDRQGPDPHLVLLDLIVPAKAVGDGKALAQLVLNVLRADREEEQTRRTRNDGEEYERDGEAGRAT